MSVEVSNRCLRAAALRVLAGVALVGALLVGASPATASTPACATVGTQVTCTFSYNGMNGTDGTPQNFVVPSGVRSATIEAWGAQGGASVSKLDELGGHSKGLFSVSPGATLTVRVGGQPFPFTTGGYNGGGSGATGASGGGGASDVRLGGDTLANRIIVAGGGGGLGSISDILTFEEGGVGGGVMGGPGRFCFPKSQLCPGGGPAQGGTGGNAAGCPTASPVNGTDGALGIGGNGGSCGGGGGGGGLYGGGGGSGAAGVIIGQAFVVAGGGGGGSGFVLPSAHNQINEAGIRSGNGEVTITYTPGNIFEARFANCNTLRVGYNRFINGTVVHWTVTTHGVVGTVASGQYNAIGGGKLGSKTYHFVDIPLGTTLKQNVQSQVTFTWGVLGRYRSRPNLTC